MIWFYYVYRMLFGKGHASTFQNPMFIACHSFTFKSTRTKTVGLPSFTIKLKTSTPEWFHFKCSLGIHSQLFINK